MSWLTSHIIKRLFPSLENEQSFCLTKIELKLYNSLATNNGKFDHISLLNS